MTRVEVFNRTSKVFEVKGPGIAAYLSREPFPAFEQGSKFNIRHFYCPNPIAALPLPQAHHNTTPKKLSGVKRIPIFGDITLLHNTTSLNQLDPSGKMKDNPMLALIRPYARVFELIDGAKTTKEIYDQIIHEYGHEIDPYIFLAFLDHLEDGGFIYWGGRPKLTTFDAVLSNRWDANITTIQDQFSYTELPLYTAIEMTYQCNLRCSDCYCNAFPSIKPLIWPEFKQRILRQVVESGISYVTLLGGEVLLDLPQVVEAITMLRDADIYVKLITNGTLVDNKNAALLSRSRINKIEISFDGFDAKNNDRFRGKETFDKSIQAIRLLKKEAIPIIGISVTIRNDNFDIVTKGLEDFVLTHGIHKVYFSKFYRSTSGNLGELSLQQEDILSEKCNEWIDRLSREIPRFEAVILGRRCTCGRSSAVISPNGTVKACPFSASPAGILTHEAGLKSIWKDSDLLWDIREMPKETCAARLDRANVESFCL